MKKIIIPVLFLLPLSAFADVVPLSATFNPNPLFNVSNFMPGDNKEASVIINNNTEALQTAYIEAVNISNSSGLASQMNLQIFEGVTEIYNNNFNTFLNIGPVLLSSIGAGKSKTYDLKITFLENANNDYQSKSLGFDICVGFSGSSQHCTGDTAVSEEGSTNGASGSSNGSGSSDGSRRLVIFNENALNISVSDSVPNSGSVIIIWETNIPATSQVIYGLDSDALYTLDLNVLPGLGYPLYSSEDLTKTTTHSVSLIGLIPGETYVYRVVSRASPATASYEHKFTVPTFSKTGNVITSGPPGISWGEILGANDENSGTSANEKMVGTFSESNLASVFGASWSSWWLWVILLLILLALGFYFYRRNEYK